MKAVRPFYTGETIDLVVPTIEHVENSSWSDWFNNQKTNQFTNHAIFPNTIEAQRDFFLGLGNSRFSLLVTAKDRKVPIGTVSLSGIDFRRRLAAIAIVMDTQTEERVSAFASLEALATLTQHAFDVMGLDRIEAGQVYPGLARWNQLLELLGYRSEGFKRAAFSRGHVVSDEVTMACLYSNYRKIADARDGVLWPGTHAVIGLVRALPKKSFAQTLDEAHRMLEAEYFGDS